MQKLRDKSLRSATLQPTESSSGADSTAKKGSGSDVEMKMGRKTRLAKIRFRESYRGRRSGSSCDWERDLIRAKREIGQNRVRGDLPEKKIEVKVSVARGIWSGPQERGERGREIGCRVSC